MDRRLPHRRRGFALLALLAALRIALGAADRSGVLDVLQAAVRTAIDQLESDMSGLRALITELRPPILDDLGTKAAIQALAERISSTGLIVDATVELAYESGRATQRHTPELELTMYRIVHKALTNAAKNGRATHGSVDVIEGATTITMSIRDDGVGFDPATTNQIRMRAAARPDSKSRSTPLLSTTVPAGRASEREVVCPRPTRSEIGCGDPASEPVSRTDVTAT